MMKSKVIVWGTGREYDKYINLVRYELKTAYYLDLAERMPQIPFCEIVIGSASGRYHTYNTVDLLYNVLHDGIFI